MNLNNEFHISVSSVGKSVSYETDPKLRSSIQCSDYVHGIVAMNEQVYVIFFKFERCASIQFKYTYPRNPVFQSLDCLIHTTSLEIEMFSHIGSGDGKVYRIEIRDKSITSWSVGSGGGIISLSVNKQGHVIATNHMHRTIFMNTHQPENYEERSY